MENSVENITALDIVLFSFIGLILFIGGYFFSKRIAKNNKENQLADIEFLSLLKKDLILIVIEEKIFHNYENNNPPMIFTNIIFKDGNNKTHSMIIDENSCEEIKNFFFKARLSEPGQIIDW